MLANIQKTFRPKPLVLRRAEIGAQTKWHTAVNFLLAFAVGYGSIMAEMAVLLPYYFIRAMMGAALKMEGGMLSVDVPAIENTIVSLFATVAPIIVLALYVKFVEKRSVRSMGFVKEHAVTDYLLGMVIAFAMFSACVGICVAFGAMQFGGYVLDGQYLSLGLLFVGFLIQGASEETVCRGFMMTTFGSKKGALAGMLFNSLVFGALHLGNPNVSVLPIVNIVLFGVLMSVLVLKLNSIWMACALHSIWNFVQGNFYGIQVSGRDMGTSVFRFNVGEGMDWLTGGSFGIEGGLACTIVQVVVIAVILLVKPREEISDKDSLAAS